MNEIINIGLCQKMDALAPRRGTDGNAVAERVLNQVPHVIADSLTKGYTSLIKHAFIYQI